MGSSSIDYDELSAVVNRVTAKVVAECGAHNYGTMGRWDALIMVAKIEEDIELLEAYGRLVRSNSLPIRKVETSYQTHVENDPMVVKSLADKVRLSDGFDLCDIGPEHFDAFWLIREALNFAPGNKADSLYPLIFEEPSRARMMSAILRTRGIVDQETMLDLLDAAGESGSLMLAEGVL